MIGVACPHDPSHQLSQIGSSATEGQLFGETTAGEHIAVDFGCSACSAVQGSPVYFGKTRNGALVEVLVSPEPSIDHGHLKKPRRLRRTIAVGVLGLATICYLATVYSWFDSSIWGGVAFFALFAALAMAYRADDNAARRRSTPGRAAR